jgi:hypothetical protein
MANSYTGLVATLFGALDQVSQEPYGFIGSAFVNAEASRVAKGQELRYPITGDLVPGDITYGESGGVSGGDTINYGALTIQREMDIPITWTGAESLELGSTYQVILENQFAQAMRSIINLMEADAAALYVNASRAYGTAGTTPFQTAGDYTDAAFLRQILIDNGCPASEIKMIVNTLSGAYIRGKQGQYQMTGENNLRTSGVLYDMAGMQIRESSQIKTHTKGTGTGYLVNNGSGIAVGATAVAIDTGSGTVVPGDIVNFADAGTHNYVVGTGVAAAGTISLNKPGVREAILDGKAMTIGGNYVANVAFHKMAVHMLSRLPPMPEGGDSAEMQEVLTHPSGINFEVLKYKQKRQITYRIGASWGWKVVKPEWMGILRG